MTRQSWCKRKYCNVVEYCKVLFTIHIYIQNIFCLIPDELQSDRTFPQANSKVIQQK